MKYHASHFLLLVTPLGRSSAFHFAQRSQHAAAVFASEQTCSCAVVAQISHSGPGGQFSPVLGHHSACASALAHSVHGLPVSAAWAATARASGRSGARIMIVSCRIVHTVAVHTVDLLGLGAGGCRGQPEM